MICQQLRDLANNNTDFRQLTQAQRIEIGGHLIQCEQCMRFVQEADGEPLSQKEAEEIDAMAKADAFAILIQEQP